MCYIEDCEDHYQPPVDPAPDCPYEDCEGGSGIPAARTGKNQAATAAMTAPTPAEPNRAAEPPGREIAMTARTAQSAQNATAV